MRCTDPRSVGFKADGKTIAWSQKDASKEYASFQLPCGQCAECRFAYAREWAVRCMHESQIHAENTFITLTYNDENIGNNVLDYRDFQLFMKKLRFAYPNREIGFAACGEYGEKTKRKHWHAIIFNWSPPDLVHKFTSTRGDANSTSEVLSKLWPQGDSLIGSVTFESAGYVARYALKKLAHGEDQAHNFKPIFKTSRKYAIGKRWLEKHWKDIFNYGVVSIDGRPAGSVPRYYVKWLKNNKVEDWNRYVTQVTVDKMHEAIKRELVDQSTRPYSNSKHIARRIISKKRKQQLLQNLKL